MNKRDLVVSGVVAAICTTILALFTDIEISAKDWLRCGPLASDEQQRSDLCR